MTERRKHPNLLFDENDIARIKRNVAEYDWARALFAEARTAVDGGPDPWQRNPDYPRFSMTYPDFDFTVPDESFAWTAQPVHQREIMEFALVAAVSGEEKYSRRLVELLPGMAEVLGRGNDLNKQSQVVNWTTGQDAADVLVAYDLVYNDPTWTPEARRKVEENMKTIGEQIMAEPSAYHLCNTAFYFQVFKVLGGCFFDNGEWITAGLDGPGGFKSLLAPPTREGAKMDMRWYVFGDKDSPHRRLQRFRGGTVDGGIWNETGGYGLNAVLSQLTFIAEAMLHYDGTNLYEYEAPGGGCLRNYFHCAIARSFSDGQPVRYGANGQTVQRSLPAVEGGSETALRIPLPGDKWDIAYLRYRDPEFAWAALQVPRRRGRANKWGYGALWHGLDASEMEIRTPAVKSAASPASGSQSCAAPKARISGIPKHRPLPCVGVRRSIAPTPTR